MSTEQQYRVIGKSGPGVDWRSLPGDTMIRFAGSRSDTGDKPRLLGASAPMQDWWDNARYEILEAISPPQAGKCGRPLMPASHVGVPCGRPSGHAPVSGLCEPPPQAAVAACESWCGLPFGDKRVPPASDHPSMVVESHEMAALCVQNLFVSNCPHPAYCTQVCLDRTKAAKAPECIRSACKVPPVAGGELCVAHAGQVEAAKARCAWQVNGVSACGLPSTGGRLCQKHEAELRASDAAPNPPPPGTRLERWRREHKGYSHGAADPRIHDANVAAIMMGIDGPREPYVPPPKPDPWTPREVDMDIPDAWELP